MLKFRMNSITAPFTRRKTHISMRLEDYDLPVIVMYYQPIVNYSDGADIIGHEALARSPQFATTEALFASIALKNSNQFDAQCRRIALETYSDHKTLYVNISALALSDYIYGIQDTVAAALRCGFSLQRLVLEITEHHKYDNLAHLANQIDEVKALGIRIAIDDCGAGYNNLDAVIALNPDILKISSSLTHEIHLNKNKQVVMRSLVDMAKGINAVLIAEGIEQRLEAECLNALGVDIMQGYYFGRPEKP